MRDMRDVGNKARVSLKHNGTLPAKIELDAFRSTISFFFLRKIAD